MKITQALLDKLTSEAKASPRLRMNYDLRNSDKDHSQRMLNAIEPGSVVPIHRHQKSSETVEMRIVATLRNNSLFWGSHTSAERLSVILTIVRSALMNSLNVYQYMVHVLKTIHSYKGDLTDLLANKWKPAEAALVPIIA